MKEKLSIKEQLQLVRHKCPDVWERIIDDECVIVLGLLNGTCNGEGCLKCWDKALEDDK